MVLCIEIWCSNRFPTPNNKLKRPKLKDFTSTPGSLSRTIASTIRGEYGSKSVSPKYKSELIYIIVSTDFSTFPLFTELVKLLFMWSCLVPGAPHSCSEKIGERPPFSILCGGVLRNVRMVLMNECIHWDVILIRGSTRGVPESIIHLIFPPKSTIHLIF